MCKQEGSWFQAAVLTVDTNSSTNSLAQTQRASPTVFSKTSRYENFLRDALGQFLSPRANSTDVTTAATATTTDAASLAYSPLSYLLLLSLTPIILSLW